MNRWSGLRRDHAFLNMARPPLAKLRGDLLRIVGYVDNEVAHYNQAKGQFSQGLSFGDITQGINLIVDLSVKYRLMIIGKSMAKTVIIDPWIGIFDQGWDGVYRELLDASPTE